MAGTPLSEIHSPWGSSKALDCSFGFRRALSPDPGPHPWQLNFGKARTRIEKRPEIIPNSFTYSAVIEMLLALCWACPENPKVGCLCDSFEEFIPALTLQRSVCVCECVCQTTPAWVSGYSPVGFEEEMQTCRGKPLALLAAENLA